MDLTQDLPRQWRRARRAGTSPARARHAGSGSPAPAASCDWRSADAGGGSASIRSTSSSTSSLVNASSARTRSSISLVTRIAGGTARPSPDRPVRTIPVWPPGGIGRPDGDGRDPEADRGRQQPNRQPCQRGLAGHQKAHPADQAREGQPSVSHDERQRHRVLPGPGRLPSRAALASQLRSMYAPRLSASSQLTSAATPRPRPPSRLTCGLRPRRGSRAGSYLPGWP